MDRAVRGWYGCGRDRPGGVVRGTGGTAERCYPRGRVGARVGVAVAGLQRGTEGRTHLAKSDAPLWMEIRRWLGSVAG